MVVLLPIDASQASLRAAHWVAHYCGDRSALRPLLLNVQRPPLQAWPDSVVGRKALEEALQQQGLAIVEPVRTLLTEAGFEPETLVRLGHPSATILEVAEEHAARLVIMGTRGEGVLGGFALGSVALRIAPAAQCPVVLVKPDAVLPTEWGVRLRVTAPLDGSVESTSAVRRLIELAGLLGSLHVNLVHFQPALTLLEAVLPPHDDVLRSWSDREADEAIATARQLLADAGISHEVHRLAGEPATGIARFAEEHQAELIAMATHGTGRILPAALGSVALKTAHLSRVPVALMR
ncbi:universal stress protein [Aquabacterium sp. A7-Y]|uniref:universal stress protein n=1 Tax=Aquabacterium sp. A7-Y TaxID=1349605 RepID=UPI00223C99C7|nr:universal stress protein [Aquabacterium sp. A7-Y]MCW7541196.1 universal stress protein [Aquabacterium sp. A7-Y]